MIIDLSSFNTVTDWDAIKNNNNIDGVIVRVGFRGYGKGGVLSEDAKFGSHVNGAVSRNIPIAFYFMSQAIDAKEAAEEVAFCENLIERHIDTSKEKHILFIDSEYSNKDKNGRADFLSKEARSNVVKAFCGEARSRGFYAGIYASKVWYVTMLNANVRQYADVIWCAQYYSKLTASFPVDLWQYTSDCIIPGMRGRVDASSIVNKQIYAMLGVRNADDIIYWLTICDASSREDAEKTRETVKKQYPNLKVGLRRGKIEHVEVLD